ncbi:MAG: hypothetical protein ABFD89_00825 [Bryobacteraceae bacterium]
MSVARMQEILVAVGKNKQSAIGTANTAAEMLHWGKLNASTANPKLNTENDADEYGKGHEWATQNFKTSWDVGGSFEKHASAEFAAWAFGFGLGKVVETGTSPNYVLTCTPLIPSAGDDVELPLFSVVEQMRPGASAILDRMAVGCAIESVQLAVGHGPGRDNSKLTVEYTGSGKLTEPSTITMPADTAEKLLPSASLTLTINGVDYVANRNILSLETGWKNNIPPDYGFYPGSDFQTSGDGSSGAIRGRMLYGKREGNLKFTAFYEYGSTELALLKAQTTGTAAIGLSYDTNNALTITWQQVAFATAEVAETDGWVTVSVECTPQYHATNGLVTVVAKSGITGIAQAAA